MEYYTAQPKKKTYTRAREGKLPQDQKEGQLGDLLDRAMQKHVIRTIQQKKLKKIKKNIKKVIAGEELQMDVMQSITNIIIYPSKQWKELRSKNYLITQAYFE
jgi:hypothetical protein